MRRSSRFSSVADLTRCEHAVQQRPVTAGHTLRRLGGRLPIALDWWTLSRNVCEQQCL